MGPEERDSEFVEASSGSGSEHDRDDDPRLVEGIKCVQEGCFTEAIPLLKAVLREDETSRDAWYGLGYCYYKHGNLLQSRLLFERSLDLGNRAAAEMLARIEYRLAKGHHNHGVRIPPSVVSIDGSEEYRSPEPLDEAAGKQDEPTPELGGASEDAAQDADPVEASAVENDVADEPETPPVAEEEAQEGGQLELLSDEPEKEPAASSPLIGEHLETLEEDAAPESSPTEEGAEVPEWETPSESELPEAGEETPEEEVSSDSRPRGESDEEVEEEVSAHVLLDQDEEEQSDTERPEQKDDAIEDDEPEEATGSVLDQLTARILEEEEPGGHEVPAEAPVGPLPEPALSDETPYPDLFSRLVSEPGLDEDDGAEALLIGAYDFAGTATGLWGIAWAAVLVTLLTGGIGLPFGVVWVLRYIVTRSVVADGKLEFRGTGAGLLGWYLLFAVPLAALAAMVFFVPDAYRLHWAVLAGYGGLALFIAPYLFARWTYSRMYWCKRRFLFEADFAEWFGVYTIYVLLCPLITVGLLLPWGVKRYILWECKTIEVAGRCFSFHGRAMQLLGWMLLNLALLPVHILTLGFSAAWIVLQGARWFVKNRRFVDRDPGLGSLPSEN